MRTLIPAAPLSLVFSVFISVFFIGFPCIALTGESRVKTPSDTMVVLLAAPLLTLDPLQSMDSISQKVGNLVHGALIRIDEKLRIQPDLAQRWSVHEKQIKFWLKPGIKFHDGTAITPGDVVQCIRWFSGLERGGSPSAHLGSFGNINRVQALQDGSILVELKKIQPFLLMDFYLLKIFKPGPLIKDGGYTGSGRFVVDHFTDGKILLRRFREFHETPPLHAPQYLFMKYVRDDTTRYQQLVRGDLDVVLSAISLSKSNYLKQSKLSWIQIKDMSGLSVQYLAFNFRNPILKQIQVRQAIAHSINIDQLLKFRLFGYAERAVSLLSPFVSAYTDKVKKYEYDPQKAELLLDQGGRPRHGANGLRFSLSFKVTPNKQNLDIVRIIAADLKRVGIDVHVEIVEEGRFFADIRNGKFDIYSSRWVGVKDPSIFYKTFHSSQIGATNRIAYYNSDMDQLIEQGLATLKHEKQNRIFEQVQQLAAEDLPYLMLWYWSETVMAKKNIHNIIMNPAGDYSMFAFMTKE